MDAQTTDEAVTAPAVRRADTHDLEWLPELAARTFPLACPPDLSRDHIAAFIDENLGPAAFRAHLTAPEHHVFVQEPHGYALVLHGTHEDEGPLAWRGRRSAYLSKLYVDPGHHGGGLARNLLEAALEQARADDCVGIWLGVNSQNFRAQRFYAKTGFEVEGEREFTVGSTIFVDAIYSRPVA